MGFQFGLAVVFIVGGLYWAFGLQLWLIILAIALFIAGFLLVNAAGHRAFKTGANTDVVGYCAVIFIAIAIAAPKIKEAREEQNLEAPAEEFVVEQPTDE